MAGIYGVTFSQKPKLGLEELNIKVVEEVHKEINFQNSFVQTKIVYFDFQETHVFHKRYEELEIWIYGDPLVDNFSGSKAVESTFKLLLNSYPNFSVLSNVDGLFTVLVLDKAVKKLFLINDRNGLSHVFYNVIDNQLIWGSELRSLLSSKTFLEIDKQNLFDFLNLGYFIADDTLFKEVKMLPPSSVLEWDFERNCIKDLYTYWSHKELKKNTIKKSKTEVVNDLKYLFENAVKKRVGINEKVGVTLSGGLDSRLIFANIPHRENGFTAITRGKHNAGDILLAKRVTSLRVDCNHKIYELKPEEWLDRRREGIFATSGQKDIFNMNALGSIHIHKQYFDINLDGAGGDGIFAGGHLKYEDSANLAMNLKNSYFKNSFENVDTSVEKLKNYYLEIASDHFFYISQRVRHFTIFGSILGHDYGIISRFPFLDHDLQDYFYQLDERLDKNELYLEMLIKYFSSYFVDIDCLDTGYRLYSKRYLNFIAKVVNRGLEKLGYRKYDRRYHDYEKWLRDYNIDYIKENLFNKEAILYKYVDYKITREKVDDYIINKKNAKLMSRLLTVSIFLEEIKNEGLLINIE